MAVLVKVAGLALDEKSKAPIVVLKDEAEDRLLPIVIGILEASSIAASLEGVRFPRPMTHDLMLNAIQSLGAKVFEVEVTDIIDDTFHGVVRITSGDRIMELDSRPSDAIALALRVGSPVLVSARVFEKTTPALVEHEEALAGDENLLASFDDEDFGKYPV